MPDNNSYDTAYVAKLTCSSSNQSVDVLQPRHHVSLVADGDCFVNFDKAVTATSRYLLKANTPVELEITFSRLNYLADSATPAIYVVAST